ncbi:putative ribonuclease H-like domain-containing protein [Tanacetum coccineum]
MSDSKDSTVTYTTMSSPFEDLLDIGSPGVDGPPIMPDDPYAYVVAAFQAPPSPDYVPGPEEPQASLPLYFVLEPVYPEFMPPDDEVLPEEEQPLPAAASPTDQSPGYIPESDPEEDPEEDDEDPEEDPADYPADRDDDDEEDVGNCKVAFILENTSSTNDVSTAYGVSNTSGQNSQYEHTSSYSLLANQSGFPQLDHEDLEQIDEFDLEEIDLKWQVAMISIRMKKFYKKTGRKLQFDAKEPVGFDKTKVKCYNCHKTGHFTRKCRTKGNQDSKRRDAWNSGNKDGRRYGKQEDSKALVTIDGEGVDWTSHSEQEEDYALMACNNSGSDTEVSSYSKECKESYAKLKKLYDEQRAQLSDASIEIQAYTQGLKKVEAQLVAHQQGQLWYEEKIRFMKIDLDDKTDVLTYHKKLLAGAQKEKEDLKAKVEKWHNSSKNLGKLLNTQMSANDKFGLGYGDHRYDGILSYENEVLQSVFMNKESDLENQPLYDRFVTAEGMHAVPPPMTGNYMPSRPDIEIDYLQFTYGPKQSQPSESETQTSEFDTCESNISVETPEFVSEPVVNEPSVVCQPKVWYDAPIIEEYESDSEDEYVSLPTKEQETPSFANEQVKTPRETVKNQFTHSKNPKVDKKGLGYRFTTKACFVCGSLTHLIRDYDFHEKRMAKQAELNNRMRKKSSQREIRTIWNNVQRVNHKNQFVPTSVLTRTGKIPVNTARASGTNNVSTARHNFNKQAVPTNAAMKVNIVKPIVNRVRPKTIFHNTHSPFTRPFNNTTALRTNFSKQKVNTAEVNAVSAVGGKRETVVKPSVGCNWRPQRHYWHKISKYNGGLRPRDCVTFKDPLGKLKPKQAWAHDGNKAYLAEYQDFMGPCCFWMKYVQKNKVLFTDSELSCFSLMNIRGLACLIAKATIDESNKWHRRLGHVNFKNLNKLVKGNLIKREYSNARTPQQNGVAERKNRTLIEAARTMLADSFLPNTFWAEAVSTACHVLNRVLVTKPQNKTPYELVTGKGPTWLFDLDYLTDSTNYQPMRSENQANIHAGLQEANQNAGTEDIIDAGNSKTEAESAQDYFVLPIWSSYSSTVKRSTTKNAGEAPTKHPDLKTDEKPVDKEDQVFLDELERLKRQEKDVNDAVEALRKEFAQETKDLLFQAGAAKASSTDIVNTASTPVSITSPYGRLSFTDLTNTNQDDSEILALEEIYDNPTDEPVVNVSPIPTSRINSIHPSTLILGDPQSSVQTRSKVTKSSEAYAFVSYIQKQKRNNHKDFQHCLFACFLSQHVEPKKIHCESLEDESWFMHCRNKLLQFKIQKVWILVDLPYGKNTANEIQIQYIKWNCEKVPVQQVVKPLWTTPSPSQSLDATLSTFLLKNGYIRGTIDKTLFIKKDKHDIILVQVYVDDIIFGSTKKSWCDEFEALMKSRFQMSSMGELTFFLGLQVKQKEDGIFISQDKYVAEILKKFDFVSVKTASTPIETHKPLVKDEEASDVDVHLYRSMIGSLMYLTASRPDIMFAVCACSRFQVTPKTSHLSVVKRIFRYLKVKPKLGLWYPRVSLFDLEAYSDSDYAGANLDRKSTTGGCHFLDRRLISWQCKKQTIVATSTIEA